MVGEFLVPIWCEPGPADTFPADEILPLVRRPSGLKPDGLRFTSGSWMQNESLFSAVLVQYEEWITFEPQPENTYNVNSKAAL